MDFQQLKNFQAVARCGNISRAAREMYIAQPSLSKSISKLEAELGVPLFTHRKGKIELNDYGRMFLSSVDLAFSQLSTGAQTIARMYENDQHILSIASNISGYLPDMLPAFLSSYPEIGIRQRDCSTQQMTELLLDRTVTLGISCEKIENEMLEFEELGRKGFVLAVHQDHPLAANDFVRIHQLENEVFICDTTRLRMEPLQKLCLKEGFTPKVGYEIENNELIYSLVESNRGIAILPLGLCCQLMHHHPGHHIRLVRIDEQLDPVIIGIAYHKSFQFTKAAAMFVNYMKQRLAEEEELITKMGYN